MSLVNQFNTDVQRWALATKRKIKLEVLSMVVNIGPGHNDQRIAVRRYHGEASKVNFSFPYYMVFVHKGAGRGYGGNKSHEFTTALGKKKRTSLFSMGKMGTGKRKPKPWFNPVIEREFPELAEIVADYKGDQIIDKIQKILIR